MQLQPPADAPPERREFAGVRLDVVSVPSRRPVDGRPHLFVLSPFGWSHDYWRPHLDPLHELFAVHYIRLPAVRDLTGQSGYGDAIPIYPVERLAKAFEELRRARKVERVLLLAEGPAAWIAETYALRYPSRAAGLVLVNAWIDADSYAAALRRTAELGDGDERAVARSLLGLDASARDPAEDRWMGRTWLTHRLVDRSDLLGHLLCTRTRDEQGFSGKYHSVRRYVRRLSQQSELAFRRIEVEPGQEMQVDYGTGARCRDQEGKLCRTHVFRLVLSHSRKGYSEAVRRLTTESFIRSLENAFWT